MIAVFVAILCILIEDEVVSAVALLAGALTIIAKLGNASGGKAI